jgi:hypothetical protein
MILGPAKLFLSVSSTFSYAMDIAFLPNFVLCLVLHQSYLLRVEYPILRFEIAAKWIKKCLFRVQRGRNSPVQLCFCLL